MSTVDFNWQPTSVQAGWDNCNVQVPPAPIVATAAAADGGVLSSAAAACSAAVRGLARCVVLSVWCPRSC